MINSRTIKIIIATLLILLAQKVYGRLNPYVVFYVPKFLKSELFLFYALIEDVKSEFQALTNFTAFDNLVSNSTNGSARWMDFRFFKSDSISNAYDLLIDYFFHVVSLLTTILIFFISRKNHEFLIKTNEMLTRSMIEEKGIEKRVSVLIAARNEENKIESCVRSLMHQSYSNYEVLVMNDSSTDATGSVLERLKQEFDKSHEKKFQFFTNSHLPDNWYGKSWSVHCLSKKATGEILIITDADTIHNYLSVRFCAHSLLKTQADFLSGFPQQNLSSIGLKILVPSMFIMTSYVVPLWLIDSTKSRNISIAIGQLMVISKKVFDDVGGLEKVSDKICEDLQFARLLKASGYKTKFIALEDHVNCNMYESFGDAFLGMARNVFCAIDYQLSKYCYMTLIFGSILHPLIMVWICDSNFKTIINGLSICIFICSWMQTMKLHGLPAYFAFFYPIMIVLIFCISAYSTLVTFFTKGHVWKGRRVS